MKSLSVLFLFILLFSFQNIAEAQPEKEISLMDIDSLSVDVLIMVEELSSGILEQRLNNRLELRLRQNNIAVTPHSFATLTFFVGGVPVEVGNRHIGYAYHASLELIQPAFLLHNDLLTHPITYLNSDLMVIKEERATQEIRETLDGLLDEFLNDYLKANK